MVYFMVIIGDTSNVSQSSCSRIIHQFCKFFIQHYFYLVKWYDNQEEIDKAKKNYFQSPGVKGLLGIIDGTMIQIKGVSGADKLAYICRLVGLSGHSSIFFTSTFLKRIFCFKLSKYDPNAGFLVADSGYGLSSVLITPFSQPTTPEEIYFYKVHCQVRSEFERCIGHLKNRWRCLHKIGGTLQYTPRLEVPDDIDFEYDEDDVQHELTQANQVRLGIVGRNHVKSYRFANQRR
ncbi:putative nuclease HARBI1 [Hydra vulgaris]|uniref:putative nuclease HARBI1 n=1 Tax=Hydra vulgaris TaxID=6087 RepID=UPI001F5E7723|nr:putative nuclease HARBI1 [Hydra vulgaris]